MKSGLSIALWTIIYFFEQKAKELWGVIKLTGTFFKNQALKLERECKKDKVTLSTVLFVELFLIFLLISLVHPFYNPLAVCAFAFMTLVVIIAVMGVLCYLALMFIVAGLILYAVGFLIFKLGELIVINAKMAYNRANKKFNERANLIE